MSLTRFLSLSSCYYLLIVDHVLIIHRDCPFKINPEEVDEAFFVEKDEWEEVKKTENVSPWFLKIADKFLMQWWEHLDDLENVQDLDIHNIME
jgi:isopentenyldiphosphate isomerase